VEQNDVKSSARTGLLGIMTTAQVPPQLPVFTPEPVPEARALDGKLIVRRLLAAFGFIAATVLVLVFALTWLFSVANAPVGSDAVIVLGIILGLILPITGFAISSNWPFAAMPESRKILRRFLGVILCVEFLCVDAIILMGIVTAPPLWIPIALVACFVVFSAAGILVAPVLRSTPSRGEIVPLVGWVAPATKRPVALYVAIGIFLLALIAGILLTSQVDIVSSEPHGGSLTTPALLLFVAVGLIGAAPCFLVRMRSATRQLRQVASPDYAQARRIRRAIYGARGRSLEPVDLERARVTAILSASLSRWSIGFYVCLFGGLVCSQLSSAIVESSSITLWIVGVMAAIGLANVLINVKYLLALQRFVATRTA
jgi:hypothetical protein